ncbi:hypothetical protein, partial [Salinisphaera sp. G21_0]|uniref:hypothetical protein n=1 Tax=Salinisphaera sp. G21_0 TaxID=2821094 RepID=UPI001ADBAE0E
MNTSVFRLRQLTCIGVAAAVRYPVTHPTARLPDQTGKASLIPVAWNFTGLTRSYSIVVIPKRFSNWKQGGPPNKPCSHL